MLALAKKKHYSKLRRYFDMPPMRDNNTAGYNLQISLSGSSKYLQLQQL